MLKTNSKQAREKIRNYIISLTYFEDENKNGEDFANFKELATALDHQFIIEHWSIENEKRYYSYNEYNAFCDWCQGLPSVLDTADYYVHNRAITILGDLLEETEQERNKYTEEQAEQMLTYLIYREIKNAIK